ncbi:hypothetical protein PRIPAC_93275 [Pristionchus pacificus]|uniref:Ubiquitin-conjugating enzyme n=1 Tax=Pristionchus pacificus TaxID=54126 RepID=A0A2A6BBT8_PRIPA|nr:hypothetical protein PRIPAC_93275 [Pristionchus pacificus]|eukprot:PDM63339.1 Ubiquitin-conjugating enzyme [Pristionchus pacificus]
MSNISAARLAREMREIVTAKDIEATGIILENLDDKLTKMRGFINGPPDSPYETSLTLRTVLLSVQSLLDLPEPKDPQDAVVAKQKMSEPELFEKTARFWTQHYANGSGEKDAEFLQKIKNLKEMGVNEDKAISTLSCCGWSSERSIDYIFN